MALNLVKVTDPSFEPVTLAEAKTHMRVTISADDTFITSLITAAREQVEEDLGAAIGNTEYDLKTDEHLQRKTPLPRQPALSITSVKYTDDDDQEQTVNSANYTLEAHRDPPEVELDEDYTIPGDADDAVIRFKVGYADAVSVPQLLKQAVLFLVAHWYEFREPVLDLNLKPVPDAYRRIVGKKRVKRFR